MGLFRSVCLLEGGVVSGVWGAGSSGALFFEVEHRHQDGGTKVSGKCASRPGHRKQCHGLHERTL